VRWRCYLGRHVLKHTTAETWAASTADGRNSVVPAPEQLFMPVSNDCSVIPARKRTLSKHDNATTLSGRAMATLAHSAPHQVNSSDAKIKRLTLKCRACNANPGCNPQVSADARQQPPLSCLQAGAVVPRQRSLPMELLRS
jgi:hypothetical protein